MRRSRKAQQPTVKPQSSGKVPLNAEDLLADPRGKSRVRDLVLATAVETVIEENNFEATQSFASKIETFVKDLADAEALDAYIVLSALDFVLTKYALSAFVAADESIKEKERARG